VQFASVLSRSALVGVLAAAALLAGCGRKGPMELPPSAQMSAPDVDSATGRPQPILSSDGYPIAPRGDARPIALDRLID
jgi:predicted small lipoprotein YifL